MSAPITITGENGTSATLTPQDIAAALSFRPDPAAGLAPELNLDAITKVLQPQLAASETPGRDATLDFTGGAPVVVPSQDGRGVDYPATLKALLPVLTAPAPRQVAAVYGEQPAKLTTEGLSKLGISGIIGEFTTRGFAADSGHEHQAGRRADQRHDRASRAAPSASTRSPTPATPRTATSRRGSSRTGTRPAASAAASRRSPPRSTTRPTSRA